MVYVFAQQSGGFIHIESEPGQRTTVRLYLPRMAPSVERQSGTDRPPQPGYSDEIVAQIGQLEDRALVLRKPYDGNALSAALSRSFGH